MSLLNRRAIGYGVAFLVIVLTSLFVSRDMTHTEKILVTTSPANAKADSSYKTVILVVPTQVAADATATEPPQDYQPPEFAAVIQLKITKTDIDAIWSKLAGRLVVVTGDDTSIVAERLPGKVIQSSGTETVVANTTGQNGNFYATTLWWLVLLAAGTLIYSMTWARKSATLSPLGAGRTATPDATRSPQLAATAPPTSGRSAPDAGPHPGTKQPPAGSSWHHDQGTHYHPGTPSQHNRPEPRDRPADQRRPPAEPAEPWLPTGWESASVIDDPQCPRCASYDLVASYRCGTCWEVWTHTAGEPYPDITVRSRPDASTRGNE